MRHLAVSDTRLFGGDCVHPLLVYADLLATDIDRNLDAAQRIYEKHLRGIIEAR